VTADPVRARRAQPAERSSCRPEASAEVSAVVSAVVERGASFGSVVSLSGGYGMK